MKHITILMAILIMTVTALSALSADSIGQAISGTVVNANDKPVVHARVIITTYSQDKPKIETVTTDKAGVFRSYLALDSRNPRARILVVAKGYCANSYYYAKSDEPLKISLTPGYTLKGKVVDEKGKALSGAKVVMERAYAYGNGTNINVDLPDDLRTVTTGKDGLFSFSNMPSPDDFQYITENLTISAPGRALVHKYISKDMMSNVIKIKDPLECRIYGTLYLPDKKGFAPEGTPVMLQVPLDEDMSRGSEARSASVGKNGKFQFAQLPPGKVNVMLDTAYRRQKIEPRAWALPAMIGIEISSKQPKELELVMVSGALIKGKVVDKITGKGVASASLEINHPGRPKGAFADYTMTDSNGEFAIRVVDGQVTISVEQINDERNIWFQPDQRPTTTVNIAQGEVKSDITLSVDPDHSSNSSYAVQNKPVPPDFELKPGVYDLTWDPDIDCSQAVYISARYNGEKPDTLIKKLPKLISSDAKHIAYQIDGSGDDGLLLAAIDESMGTGKGWDTAYIDANRNGDLTDDKPIHIATGNNGNDAITDWVTVKSHQGLAGGEQTNYPLQVKLVIYSGSSFYSHLEKKGGWKGTIDTNKGKVECVAIDATSDGHYGDLAVTNGENLQYERSGDNVFIDTNGFGKVVVTNWSPHNVDLYNNAKVGDKFYKIKVSPLGNKISIEPYEGQLGQLLVRGENIQGLKATTQQMSVLSGSGYYTFSKCDGKTVTLPVGKYRVYSCNMVLDTRNKLSITCAPDDPVLVNADKQSTVKIGGKLSLALIPDNRKPDLTPGSSANITWKIMIGDKTTISAIGRNSEVNSPKVSFIRNGKVLHTVSAGYT